MSASATPRIHLFVLDIKKYFLELNDAARDFPKIHLWAKAQRFLFYPEPKWLQLYKFCLFSVEKCNHCKVVGSLLYL